MAKRFIDSAIWSDPWFQEIEIMDKLFFIYLFSNCDMIGLWEFNPKRAEFDLGKKIPWESIKKSHEKKVLFTEKYWIIKTFISQQYPLLNKKPTAPLHVSVLNMIEKKGLNFDLNSLSIDYVYPIHSLQVIVKEKVIVKEEVKEGELFPDQTETKKVLTVPDHLKEVWPKFLEMRKKIKKDMTEYAQELAIGKLLKISSDKLVQIEIVKRSIEHSWQTFYPLKDDNQQQIPTQTPTSTPPAKHYPEPSALRSRIVRELGNDYECFPEDNDLDGWKKLYDENVRR
jgi:hypothetical protein